MAHSGWGRSFFGVRGQGGVYGTQVSEVLS